MLLTLGMWTTCTDVCRTCTAMLRLGNASDGWFANCQVGSGHPVIYFRKISLVTFKTQHGCAGLSFFVNKVA